MYKRTSKLFLFPITVALTINRICYCRGKFVEKKTHNTDVEYQKDTKHGKKTVINCIN